MTDPLTVRPSETRHSTHEIRCLADVDRVANEPATFVRDSVGADRDADRLSEYQRGELDGEER